MGYYEPPPINVIVEAAKDSWSWAKWVLGILGAILTGVVLEMVRRFLTKDKQGGK